LSATGQSRRLLQTQQGRRQRRYTTHTTVGPQVECNRTVKEIAVDRAGEEAEEILNTYKCWSSG